MPDDRIEQALTQLFALVRDAARQQNDFAVKWAEEHGRLREQVARLEENFKAPSLCPEPARCEALEARIEKVESDAESLRESRAAVQGGWKSVMLVASGVGGAAGFAAAVAIVVQWLKGSPPAHP